MRRPRLILLFLTICCFLQPANVASQKVQQSAGATPGNPKGSTSSNSEDENKRDESSSHKPSRSNVPATHSPGVLQSEENKQPIELTARNFGRSVGDGNVWLIEFYSPHCVHCIEFANSYQEIATKYHTNREFKIKVGKINGDAERALSSRFNIYAYPSFFVVDGLFVYSFDSSVRTKRTLMKFVEGGYKDQDPIPFYSSPMGPMGLMQGTLIAMGVVLSDVFSWTEEAFGLSPMMTGGVLFGSMFMGSFFTIVFLAIVITPKVKND